MPQAESVIGQERPPEDRSSRSFPTPRSATSASTSSAARHGYLVNTRDLCAAPATIDVDYIAQNGKTLSQTVKAKTACGKAKTQRKRHRR